MLDILATITVAQLVLVPLGVLGLYGLGAFLAGRPNKDHTKANWTPVEAVGITIAIYVLAQVVAGLTVGVYIALTSGNTDAISDLLTTSPLIQFLFVLAVDAVSALMIYSFLKRRHTAFRAIGIVRPQWRDIGYAAMGFLAYMVAYIVVIQLVQASLPQVDLDQRQDLGFSTSTDGFALLPIFLSLVILPPLIEETLMRGVLYTGLRQRLSFIWAGIITSGLFASAHLLGGADTDLLWVAAIDTFVLSMVLVWLREKTGSLWPGIGLHALKNGIAFTVLFIFHIS